MSEQTEEEKVELVTMSDILQLSSWDRPRTDSELASFVTRHELALADIKEE